MELTAASNQWFSRPDDQRFTSLNALLDYKLDLRRRSKQGVVSSRRIEAQPLEDNKGLLISGPNGGLVTPTNWAFGQLCARAGAPAGFLRELPSPLAADALNYCLQYKREIEDVGILLSKNANNTGSLHAVTGPNYGRIWDADVIKTLVDRFGDGLTGDWRVPGEFGKAVQVTKANTTIYASDRDCFVFLADEKNRIEIPNRRDGKSGLLARGFFVENSEVGKSTFSLSTFYFDYVCCNRIVWGAEGFQKISIRHTASAPDRWLTELEPALVAYSNRSDKWIKALVSAAQETHLNNVDDFLAKRFGKRLVGNLKAIHSGEEGRPIETLWDVSTAVTAYARSVPFIDQRVELEEQAGKVLDLVKV